MSALFNQAKRQEQVAFFRRLDYQWGGGLKQHTHPDHLPLRGHDNVAEPKRLAPVTKLPRTHLVKPSNNIAGFQNTKPAPRDESPNSGLHFVRGMLADMTPSPIGLEQPELCGSFWPSREPMYRQVYGSKTEPPTVLAPKRFDDTTGKYIYL